ncbi:unnamed protein product [Protopolystoma xenopodis]|uniref:Uncharacterized protein n=1 Tax=Protopolystoma xenopodis TaxID=117903 RepID=A0A448WSD8_9PLAT|nr:unnamed protein product [Protopolystoma xenopodis]
MCLCLHPSYEAVPVSGDSPSVEFGSSSQFNDPALFLSCSVQEQLSSFPVDRTDLFLLQLACLLARAPDWRRRRPRVRVFLPIPSNRLSNSSIFGESRAASFSYPTINEADTKDAVYNCLKKQLTALLSDLRIPVSLFLFFCYFVYIYGSDNFVIILRNLAFLY